MRLAMTKKLKKEIKELFDELREYEREQGKLAGKKELAKTILNEGYAVADKRYIAVEVERLKSQIKDGEKR